MWVIIVHSLYDLKSSGASFRVHLANTNRKWSFNLHFMTAMCGYERTLFFYPKNSMILQEV